MRFTHTARSLVNSVVYFWADWVMITWFLPECIEWKTSVKSKGLNGNLIPSFLAFAVCLGTSSLAWPATYMVIQDFDCSSGACGPSGPLTLDQNYNLYGSVSGGGMNAEGVVFELTRNPDDTWTQTVLHSFDFGIDGESPRFGLALDGAGSLYGTTTTGGPQDLGTTFQLSPNGRGWTINLIHDSASGPLVLDSTGNVYGPIGPGAYKNGAVAELSSGPSGWSYTALYSFCRAPGCSDGSDPQGPLAWDAAGNLYGTTLYGGIFPHPAKCADARGCGVVFRLRPRPDGTWQYRILHWFGAFIDDGQLPNGGLVVDGKGNVYGSTGYGGENFSGGTVFKLSPHPPGLGQSTLYSETQIYNFPDCTQGCGPENPLVMDQAGNLYGTAGGGNTSCDGVYCGVVFRLKAQPDGTWKYSVLHKFSGPDGWAPTGITLAPDGTIYGTTLLGGKFNLGVAYEITP